MGRLKKTNWKLWVESDNIEIRFKLGKPGSAVCWENTEYRHLLFRYLKNGFPVSCHEGKILDANVLGAKCRNNTNILRVSPVPELCFQWSPQGWEVGRSLQVHAHNTLLYTRLGLSVVENWVSKWWGRK